MYSKIVEVRIAELREMHFRCDAAAYSLAVASNKLR